MHALNWKWRFVWNSRLNLHSTYANKCVDWSFSVMDKYLRQKGVERCWTHEERKYGVSTLQWRTNFWLLIQMRKIDAHYQRPIRSRRTQKLKLMRPQCRAPDKSLQLQLILFWGEFAVYCLLINAKMWLSSVIVNHISWGWREGLADKSICHSFRTKMWFPALTMVAQNHL